MKNLLRFILNYNFVLLFIIFETLAVSLTIKNSESKLSTFMTSANSIIGIINSNTASIKNYFNLKAENKALVDENIKLKRELSFFGAQIDVSHEKIENSNFTYTTAEVIKNSVSNTNNFITINKGSNDGIKPDMAIVSSEGVIGVTAKVSNNFSTVVSLLNTKLNVSAKLKSSDYFGSISWSADNYRTATLTEIPEHVKLKKGDTIVTSGYSAIFPKDIIIGFVDNFKKIDENNFLEIEVLLSQDFKRLRYVYVIENKIRLEKDSLENKTNEVYHFE